MFCTLKIKILSLVTLGLMLATVGLVMYLTFPIIMDGQIKKRLVIKEDSLSYKYWQEVPVPIYIQFYFFNITNPEEVYDLKKPVLEELGPYTFREHRVKVNITWHKNGTVSYQQIKRWYYQPDKTEGSLNDSITTLNVPMVAAAAQGKQMNQDLIFFALDEMFDSLNCSWLVTKTVDELLFKGYPDKLIKLAKAFFKLPYDKFGWFYERNNTDDGQFLIYTGEDDIEKVGSVDTWNDQKSVTSYSPPCNMINGSAGDFWPPELTYEDKPTIFITDLCRSLSFSYLNEVTIKNIKTYRYWADDKQLDNGKYDPSNKCFCDGDVCLPAGATNVSSCKFDAPAVVSYPHFLFADSEYSEGVVGMHPNPQKHRMYIDIIPEMGIPLGVAARMQINIVFEKIPQLEKFSNITRRTYFPVFWFSETAEAGTDITDQLSLPLNTLPLIANIVSFVLVAIGSFLVFTSLVLAILFALGKIHDSSGGQGRVPLLNDKAETARPKNEPAYSTVLAGDGK